MNLVVSLILVCATSIGITYLLRFYAIKNSVIDIPNARSSHSVPTPRGGGVSVVLVFLAVITANYFLGKFSLYFSSLLFMAGFAVALVGFLDDHGHVNARWRILVHFSGAGLVVFACGGLPPLVLLGFDIDLGLFGDAVAVIGIVWILNLFNFMDGIDGIAGVEALSASAVMGALILVGFNSESIADLHWYLAASVAGFLVWNYPPAKIFMGDAGSGFLGLMLGAMALLSSQVDQSLLWAWLVMLGVFNVDATVTLIRRVLRGETFFEAHRSHGYQYASRIHGSHRKVTSAVGLINLIWLAPIASLIAFGFIDGFLGLLIAYLPLFLLAIKYKSGASHLQEV